MAVKPLHKFKTDKKKTYCVHDGAFMCLSAVIFTNYTDFPLNGILHWNKFSMILDEDGAHWVKDIFKGIKDADFTRLQDNLLKVKQR